MSSSLTMLLLAVGILFLMITFIFSIACVRYSICITAFGLGLLCLCASGISYFPLKLMPVGTPYEVKLISKPKMGDYGYICYYDNNGTLRAYTYEGDLHIDKKIKPNSGYMMVETLKNPLGETNHTVTDVEVGTDFLKK